MNLLLLESAAAQAQITAALASWLSIDSGLITLQATYVESVTLPTAVTVSYSVRSPKDVSEEFETGQGRRRRLTKADFTTALNAAMPQAIPAMPTSSGSVTVADPTISTLIRVRVSVSEVQYELHGGVRALNLYVNLSHAWFLNYG